MEFHFYATFNQITGIFYLFPFLYILHFCIYLFSPSDF